MIEAKKRIELNELLSDCKFVELKKNFLNIKNNEYVLLNIGYDRASKVWDCFEFDYDPSKYAYMTQINYKNDLTVDENIEAFKNKVKDMYFLETTYMLKGKGFNSVNQTIMFNLENLDKNDLIEIISYELSKQYGDIMSYQHILYVLNVLNSDYFDESDISTFLNYSAPGKEKNIENSYIFDFLIVSFIRDKIIKVLKKEQIENNHFYYN